MRKGFLGCALVSIAGASLALAQGTSSYQPVGLIRDTAALPADINKQATPVTTDGKTGPVSSVPAGLLDGNCGTNGCGGGNGVCGPQGKFWLSAEYLAWWIKKEGIPPLVTVGSPTDLVPGAIGQPGTVVVVGGDDIDFRTFSGGRLTTGMWLNDCQTKGFESNYLFLGH